ncbi:MAG TPA: acyl carrier protein [Thermoanaerobaculia bacterium]|nr:acyl carrier protein [Thermoanaerobaculia bacterium]
MTEPELRELALRVLRKIAPEADPARIDPREDLREQLDLDSMDFLNFVIGLHEALGVDIPEADYARLSSLDGIAQYLGEKVPGAAR